MKRVDLEGMEQILEFSSGTRRLNGSVALQHGIHGGHKAAERFPCACSLRPQAQDTRTAKTEHKTVLKPTKLSPKGPYGQRCFGAMASD